MRHAWVSSICMIILVGGVLLTGLRRSGDDPPAQAQSSGIIDLSSVTSNWDKNLSGTSRFTVLAAFGGAAVRDNNTGLVWEQAPNNFARPWGNSMAFCTNRTVGGTVGWRLPSGIELRSVQDPSLPAPFVPTTVFTGVRSSDYWSASTRASIPDKAWAVSFGLGKTASYDKAATNLAWCVRGPMNTDQY